MKTMLIIGSVIGIINSFIVIARAPFTKRQQEVGCNYQLHKDSGPFLPYHCLCTFTATRRKAQVHNSM